jgi:general secretion pathway protein A
MYIGHFKLNEAPFSLTPDPRFLFMSERHREGLAHLLYGVQQPGGFVQLTGEIGSGKTTLCRCLIRQLPTDTDVAMILNPRLTAVELLATVCDELRIPYPAETGSIKVLTDALNQRLLETHAQRRRTVLIIDEAQNLHSDVLEQVRLLTNLETSQEKLLQIILIGQPELLTLLKGKKLRQLAQRITARYHLLALSQRETYAYIRHRLLVAGRRDPLFTGQAMRCIYRLSGGIPRVINIICDRALLGAYALDKQRVGAAIVRRASRETRGLVHRSRRLRLAWTLGVAILIVLMVGGAILLRPTSRSIFRRDSAAVASDVHSPSEEPDSIRSAPMEKEGQVAEAAKASNLGPLPESSASSIKALTSKGPRITDILADPSMRSSGPSSFNDLYALWGIKSRLGASDLGCKTGSELGFECLFQKGSWLKLRRFNLPAILEMTSPKGVRCRMAVSRLDGETATLMIGGRQYTFPQSEIDDVWDGSFILLWKPPFAARQLYVGMHGEEVKWVRRALDRVEGRNPDSAVSDTYDGDLQQRVMAFQRERSLVPDGYVGIETLVRLAQAVEEPSAPSILHRAR